MNKLTKIGLVICASNFERHKNVILALHHKIKASGNCVLYVITNYGVYDGDMDFSHGEPADYSLLEYMDLDGCILEANLGSDHLVRRLTGILQGRGIPMVLINLDVENVHKLTLRTQGAGKDLFEHLISVHKCSNINLLLNIGNTVISGKTKALYKEVLEQNGIEYDERRILTTMVGTDKGREIYDGFDSAGVMQDADAVVCVHDVCAIALCLELAQRNISVPKDILVCSMNHSFNSITFMPDISGVDRMDGKAAQKALDLLLKLIKGEPVALDNYYEGEVCYGRSCGCIDETSSNEQRMDALRSLTLNKIDAGKQISGMMKFNDSLEKVETMDQFTKSLEDMILGIGCSSYFCCLNKTDIDFITDGSDDCKDHNSKPYDDVMTLVRGYSRNTGALENIDYDGKKFLPVKEEAGDMFLILPIHHLDRDYGYMVFLNEYLPVTLYNYRICQESIGNNIENLRRKLMLRHNIDMLDKLHMQDQLTHLYNRFAFKRYRDKYINRGEYTIAMLDMDGLKYINDKYGHQAGNYAICIVAEAISKAIDEEDLLIRYGGDEFVVLSNLVDEDYWKTVHLTINNTMGEVVKKQSLPYSMGISMGYTIVLKEEPIPIEKAISLADNAMYENKKMRKACRK
ncbi:MAG: diguanylate cyclase [Lachnospiraceae bacterium]|nr:diguanylate cyclase [Lachnospiraceae bacterium]